MYIEREKKNYIILAFFSYIFIVPEWGGPLEKREENEEDFFSDKKKDVINKLESKNSTANKESSSTTSCKSDTILFNY